MAPMTVTATQGGSTANGLLLRVFTLTGAKLVASQTGGSASGSGASGTSGTATGTVQQTTSRIYGAASLGSSAPTGVAGSGSTLVDTVKDSTNGGTYNTYKNAAPATGSQAIGITWTSSAGWEVAWLEVLAAATLAEDVANSPAVASTTAAITVTTASFNPGAGSLLVALLSSDGGAAVTTMTVTDNLGTHLNWTEKVKLNTSGLDYTGVWIADVPAAAGGGLRPARSSRSWQAIHRASYW
jgi:hypothetical protein